jgi:hypothetical protein
MNVQGRLPLNCEQNINFLLSVTTFLSLGSGRMTQNQNNSQVFGNVRAHFHQRKCAQHLCQDKWCRCCFLTCKVQFLRTWCIISKLWMVSSIQKYKKLLRGTQFRKQYFLLQGHILDSGNVCVSELQWITCKMPALQSKLHLLWFICFSNTVIWDARVEIGLWQWGKAGHCYNPTQGVRKWPAAHVWKLIGALQNNIWFVKCDLSEEAIPKPQDDSNKERCEYSHCSLPTPHLRASEKVSCLS